MIIRTNEYVHGEEYIIKALLAKDKHLRIEKVDKIYYPYAIMIYRIQMKNPKSLMNRKIMCVMDLVGGRGAVGDQDPPLVEIDVEEIMVVKEQLTEAELHQKAHDYIFKMVMSKVRVLYVPNMELEKREFFHKLFYIVQCKDSNEKDYFLLADSMDASYTLLDYESE